MTDEMARMRVLLEGGSFDLLLGRFESEKLECKQQPYQLDSDSEKLELAKDVAGLANSSGGFILIGVATLRDPDHHEDQIRAVRPFERSLVNGGRYEDVLHRWLYPPIRDLEIKWFASANDSEKGIVAISVPAIGEGDRPVLTTKSISDSGRRYEAVFGYHERKQAGVTHLSVERLQGLLRDGARFDALVGVELQAIRSLVAEMASRPIANSDRGPTLEEPELEVPLRAIAEDRRPASEILTERADSAIENLGLSGAPAYSLAAMPLASVEIPDLFGPRESTVVQSLEHPTEIRDGGFDLDTGSQSRIVLGLLRRASTDRYKSLEIGRDGALVFAGRGDQEYGLCWGRDNRQEESWLINQLVLIEQALLFSKFADQVYGAVEYDSEVIFQVELRNMTREGNPVRLEAEVLARLLGLRNEAVAPQGSLSRAITARLGEESPGRSAFRLVGEVYRWFGFDDTQIPYQEAGNEGPIISEELILSPSTDR